jgi:hypothetical protein
VAETPLEVGLQETIDYFKEQVAGDCPLTEGESK